MSLQNDIYHKLTRAIASGELGPGGKLSEMELAKEICCLEVSRDAAANESYLWSFPQDGVAAPCGDDDPEAPGV